MSRFTTRGRVGFLALCLLALAQIGVYFAVYGDGTSDLAIVIYKPAMLLACAFIALQLRKTTGRERQGWALLLLVTVAFGVLDVVWAFAERDPDFPYPNWTDPFYLSAHAANVVAVGLLTSPLWRGRDRRWMFDAGALLAVAAGLLWHFVRPLTSDGSHLASAVGLAYLMVDLLMAGTILNALYAGRLTLRNALILAAALLQAAGDALFYYYVDVYDTAWLLGTWLIAMAAVTDPAIQFRAPRLRLVRAGLAPLAVVAVVAVATLLEMRAGEVEDLLLSGVVALGLVIARQIVSLRLALAEQRRETAFRETMLDAQSDLGFGISILEGERVIYANRAAERLTGRSFEQLTALDSITELFAGEQMPAWYRWLQSPEAPVEAPFTRPDGSVLELEIVARPMAGGARPRTLLIARDVTGRREELRAVVRAQKFEGLGALAGGVAHDFNNLLSTILGNAGLLEMGELDDEARVSVEAIEAAARRGAELTRSLLDYARTPADHSAVEDLRECVAETASLAKAALPVNVRLRVESGGHPVFVRVNRGLIIQALLNLVLNARDAVGEAGEIRLALRTAAENADVTISDSGAGMDAGTVKRMFEPFFTTKMPGAGTGLGLVITQRTIREHGGHIAVDSAPGEGTSITISLPLASTAASTTEAAAG